MPVGFQAGLRLVDWILSGASVDLDFVNGRYFGSSGGSVSSYLSISRASNGYAQNSSGIWIPFSSNTLRITDRGLLIESAGTNNLLQSETPATQTTASLATGSYTLWVEGSGSALASGGSATITGAASATAGSPDTFTVTVAGTVVVTVTGSLTRFQLENGAFASSYILTTGTSATRAADAVQMIGSLATLFGGSARTSVVDLKNIAIPSSFQRVIADNNSHQELTTYSDNTHIMGAAGTALCNFASSGKTFTGGVKVGIAVSGTAVSCTGAGVAVVPDTSGQTFTGSMYLGSDGGGATEYNPAYYRRLTVWNSRLADATLQALTS